MCPVSHNSLLLLICPCACSHNSTCSPLRDFSPVPSTNQDGVMLFTSAVMLRLCLFYTKNISLHYDSSLQCSFNQTTVTYLGSFIAFLQTPGCCLMPSGHCPTQSRFVKCFTECCISRKFSCSSQGMLLFSFTHGSRHLHSRGPLFPVAVCGRTSSPGKEAVSCPLQCSVFSWSSCIFPGNNSSI